MTIRQKTSGRVYVFLVNFTDDEGDVSIMVGSSNRDKACVFLTYSKDISLYSCELQNFEFHPSCADNATLLHGLNGTVLMMLAALSIVYQHFPEIKKTDFSDKSALPGEISISLIDYYFLKTGQSWYQGMFGAELVLPVERELLKNAKLKLSKIVDMPQRTFLKKSGIFKSDAQLPDHFLKIYIENLNNHSWFALFDKLASHESTKHAFLRAVPRIMRMFELSSFASTYWTMKKSKITQMIQAMVQNIEIKPTNKKLGNSQMQGGSRDKASGMIHMHPGWNLCEIE